MDDLKLLERSREALERSYAPYSEFYVGAAVLTADDTVFTGCNIENANYSNSIHAEELALSKAVEAGQRRFDSLAVSSDRRNDVTPCGMCRQSLSEFCDSDFRIICEGNQGPIVYSLGDLLPDTITREHLQ